VEEHFCDVQIFKGPCDCSVSCEKCRIGCFKLAKFRNPSYDPGGLVKGTIYNYAEFVCADHYDEAVAYKAGYDDWVRRGKPDDFDYGDFYDEED
jgi:hypothetical protein